MNPVVVCLPYSGMVSQSQSPRTSLNHYRLLGGILVQQGVRTINDKGRYIPPEKNTPSELTDNVLMIALCPPKLKTKAPSGHFHFLMLFPPAEPVAKEYSVGWMASARTDFLWCVSVTIVLPAAKSHSLQSNVRSPTRSARVALTHRTVESMLPVIT